MTESASKWASAIRLPSVKFPNVGDTVSGVVIDVLDADVPHFNNKGIIEGVEVDEEGNVKQQLDVTLELPSGGKAVLHTGGGAIFYAIGLALANIGEEDLVAGDTLTVSYTGDGVKKAGRNAPKQYSATIVKG